MEPARAVRRRNCLKSTLYRVRKSIQGPCLEFTKESLHLRPELFNRIQIRTIRWKIDVSNTGAVQQISHCLCMVNCSSTGNGLPFVRAIPHNSKCRYGERGVADAKPKAQIILDVLSSILATQMPCRSRRSGA